MTTTTAPATPIPAGAVYRGTLTAHHGKRVAFTEPCHCWGCTAGRDGLGGGASPERRRKVTLEDGTTLHHPSASSFTKE